MLNCRVVDTRDQDYSTKMICVVFYFGPMPSEGLSSPPGTVADLV